MIWVDILAGLVLFISFIGGLKEGAVKSLFSLITLIIAIPLAGISYHFLAGVLSFLPGGVWENFVGFFITLAIISILLHLIFLLPRKLVRKAWNKGGLFRLIGAALNIFGTAIGLTVFAILVLTYPIMGWLERAVAESGIFTWLVAHLTFVQAMLPDIFYGAANMVVIWLALS